MGVGGRRWMAGTALAVVVTLLTLLARSAVAQKYGVLYSFKCGTDGAAPADGLVSDSLGNLYGTASLGGATGNGNVFELRPDGRETVLHSFAGSPTDGAAPDGNLIRDAAGNLYGVTQNGGAYREGSVFEVALGGEETMLYSFTGGLDGAASIGGMVRDLAGNLYGVTYAGGTNQQGVLFKLSPSGLETVLHNFAGGSSDGAYPDGGLIRDAAGDLYGTTSRGGSGNFGTVFLITPAGSEILLHSFAGSPGDGSLPGGGHLLRDAKGNLYSGAYDGGTFGEGMVFKLNSAGKEAALYNFAGPEQGAFPNEGLVEDRTGDLYGTTDQGGDLQCGCGLLFELTQSGEEFALHRFTGGPADGANPNGDLIRDSGGNLYGTTSSGGDLDCGTVFKLAP